MKILKYMLIFIPISFIAMCQTDKSRQISQYGNDCQRNNQDQHRVEECTIGKYTAEQSSQTGQHHSLRALHNN